MEIIITLTETEFSALSRVCADPKEWVENAAKNRARIAIEEIVAEQVKTMLADPSVKSIPANVDKLVATAPVIDNTKVEPSTAVTEDHAVIEQAPTEPVA